MHADLSRRALGPALPTASRQALALGRPCPGPRASRSALRPVLRPRQALARGAIKEAADQGAPALNVDTGAARYSSVRPQALVQPRCRTPTAPTRRCPSGQSGTLPFHPCSRCPRARPCAGGRAGAGRALQLAAPVVPSDASGGPGGRAPPPLPGKRPAASSLRCTMPPLATHSPPHAVMFAPSGPGRRRVQSQPQQATSCTLRMGSSHPPPPTPCRPGCGGGSWCCGRTAPAARTASPTRARTGWRLCPRGVLSVTPWSAATMWVC